MINLAGKKEFNFIMHPQGFGLKLLKKDTTHNYEKQYVLAPLQKYRNNFKKGDVIIFSAYTDKYQYKNDWTKQYETFIKQTQNIGMKFILISPTPTFEVMKDIYTCQEEWFRPSWAISPHCFAEVKKGEWFASNNVPIKLIEKFLIENPKVSYLDAFSILCPDLNCKNHDQISHMYRYKYHLSSYGAMKLSNTIKTLIRSK